MRNDILNLKEQIEQYIPYNEQEANDKHVMLQYINKFDDVLTRKNEFGHFTASSWAVNKNRTKVLMIYHNIYKSWAWTGGHADGESDLLKTAVRELKEETGVENVKILKDEIFSLEITKSHFSLHALWCFKAQQINAGLQNLFNQSDQPDIACLTILVLFF